MGQHERFKKVTFFKLKQFSSCKQHGSINIYPSSDGFPRTTALIWFPRLFFFTRISFFLCFWSFISCTHISCSRCLRKQASLIHSQRLCSKPSSQYLKIFQNQRNLREEKFKQLCRRFSKAIQGMSKKSSTNGKLQKGIRTDWGRRERDRG